MYKCKHPRYKDMAEMQDEFDCSDYPEYHFLYNKKNKKVLGKFKDEMCGNIIYEYVGLRSKMYSIIFHCRITMKVTIQE